jgi:hypothetical protein
VEKDSVELTCETEEGKYRPGKVIFKAKQGSSINLGKIQETIAATRLSGNTNMRVSYLEIAVQGDLVLRNQEASLLVSATGQEFELEADDRILEQRLREVAARSAQAVTVVGRVDGWSGRFPVVLRTLKKRYGTDNKTPMLLVISSLETAEGETPAQ